MTHPVLFFRERVGDRPIKSYLCMRTGIRGLFREDAVTLGRSVGLLARRILVTGTLEWSKRQGAVMTKVKLVR